jgi:hypothetical protein
MLRSAVLGFLISTAVSAPILCETIYAVSSNDSGKQLFWFDSEAPGEPLGSVALVGDVGQYSDLRIEFDPATHALYGFGVPECNITCPPLPVEPLRIQPSTGQVALLEWPGFPSYEVPSHDIRMDPATRELRAIGYGGANFRYAPATDELQEDQDLNTGGTYLAVAHPPAGSAHAGETLAIRYPNLLYDDPELARIGGVGGSPPASSGQVTLLGAIAGPESVWSFDISEEGSAFLLGAPEEFAPRRLYRLNLDTLQTEDLGPIVPPGASRFIHGIAVAPDGFGPSLLEVPTLSSWALATLALALGVAGLSRMKARALRQP